MRNLGIFLLFGVTFAACATEDDYDVGEVAGESQVLVPEVEPNSGIANATPIVGTEAVLLGNIYPGADGDFYSFSGTAGDRVYAATMTSFSPSSTDSTLTLFRADGTTVVENDLDDGSLSGSSSVIAGATLPATETYFLRVVNPSATGLIRPYELHFQLRSGVPVPEGLEPANDTVPEPLVTGWVSGSMLLATDIDLYSVTVNAGDTIYAALDLDPERDAGEFNGLVAIGPFASNLLQVNDAGSATPDGEAHFVTVKTAGTYVIAVGSTSGTGTYHLSVTVHPAASGAGCTTYTSNTAVVLPTGPALTTSVLNIPDNTLIGDVDVTVRLDHTLMTDLDVHLLTPAGNVIGLFTDIGSATFPAMDVTIDDEAAILVNGFPVTSGMKSKPETAYRLHWLDGQRALGDWTLQLYDDATANGGTLMSWSITVCPAATPPACPAGSAAEVLFSTDFEADDGGFTHSGTGDEWERGLPTAAPITTCNSGTNCWKTDLDSTYNASSSQDLVSPAIVLPGNVVGPIRVDWAQKYQVESASFDHATVDVRLVDDSNPRRLFEFKDATMTDTVGNPSVTVQESAGWGTRSADISSYAGQSIELVFHLDGDSSVNLGGLAIDDVVVTGCRLQNICGNTITDPGEQCDDGNTVGDDGCSADCLSDETCGNGIADTTITPVPEVCDDGNNVDGDGCSANCLSDESCGNDVVDTSVGEVCDDGGTTSGDGCSDDCLSDETCGNAYTDVDIGEQCDDGNTTGDDGCSADCLSDETCGNDVLDDTITPTPEVCDDGNTGDNDGCSANCLSDESCGNGIIDTPAGEVCDDSNTTPSDGCSANCRSDETCGNGVIDGTEGEQCDDGNTTGLDGCSADCLSDETCPNGVVDPGEDCDDGNTTPGDGCTIECAFEICGNGIQDPGEECDDGNTTSGDGCNATCTVDEGCGNDVVDADEVCDDGNTADGDGCSADCDSDESCGNGIEELEEQCDDGNTTGGDGCEADCTFPEPGPRCGDGTEDTGETCDDGNRMNGDGCSADCQLEPDGERGCACNGGEGGEGNLLVLGLAGLAIFGTRRRRRAA